MAWRWPACALAVLALCAVVSATGNYTRPEGTPIGNIIVEPPNPPVCPSGCKGELGPDGPSGRMGRPGARGLPGMPGVPGYDGWSTWAGWKENYRVQAVKGGRGPEGPVGPPGTPGKDGVPGVQGPPGPEGPVGQDGMSGGRGLPGPPGAGGATGPAGPVGPRGPDGAPGSIGGPGVSGPKGDLGDIGRPGAPGNIGFPGSPGEPGLDGAKGSVGDRGPLGYTGEKGFKGSNGDQGVTGNQGAMGERGATGDDGRQGMKGETGDQGLVGDMGAEGAKGESGPYIEKIGVNETNTCGAGNNGKVKFDPYLKKLYFCDGNAWLCVKSQVCDEECQVSQWGDFGACTASCGAGTMTRSRYITSMPGPNNNNRCPELVETVPCRNLPSCFCPEPSPLSNGVRFGNDFRLLSSVQWQCNTGFRLRGPTHSICRVDPDTGSPAFSSMPECLVIGCPRLTAPTNGEVQQGSPPIYNSEAVFSCNAGYRLSNTTNLRCTEAGLWSARPPICVPVMCPDPGTPVNGARNASSNTFAYQTVVGYSCNSGYVLTGSQTIECTSSGAFSGSAPQCIAIDCGRLSAPDNGGIVDSGTDYGSTARYTCDAGYRLVGDVFRLCQSSGSWSGSMPTCQLIDCGNPEEVANGEVQVISTAVTGTAIYTCSEGYLLNGPVTRICMRNGAWSDAPPTCTEVICADPGVPLNGARRGNDLSFGGELTFSCDIGYNLLGSASRVCQADGTFSGVEATCTADVCPPLLAPVRGDVFQPSAVLGSHGFYTCDTGYTRVGTYVRKCMPGGAWNGTSPSCTLNSCPEPVAPEKGFVRTLLAASPDLNNAYQSEITYSCQEGYWLRGSMMRTCQACGEWSGSEPVCEPVVCDSPETPKNGDRASANLTFQSQVDYSCNTGFSLLGQANRMCGPAGKWTTPAPSCEPVNCPPLEAPVNGFSNGAGLIFLSEVEFGCNSGYELQGSQRRTCTDSGDWSGTQPTCELVNCGDPGAVAQATQTGSSFSYGDSVSYQCTEGYTLRGSSRRVCQINGMWSGAAPVCIPVTCGDPGTPSNGARIGDVFTFGSSVSYQCNEGYRISDDASRTCLSDGTWSGTTPTCIVIVCADPGTPANGGRTLTSLRVGQSVSYTCNSGFTLQGGSPERNCVLSTDGTAAWSGSMPTCVVVDCGAPAGVSNGFFDGRSTTYTSLVRYECNRGYSLGGDATAVCQANGVWSHEAPTCDEVDCLAPVVPENGQASFTTTNFESAVAYTCNTGYTLSGSSSATCLFNRRWSSVAPKCILVSCGDPGTPANGERSGSVFTYGGTGVGYTCNAGYQLVGTARRTCQADGTWTGQMPRCVGLYCQNPGIPASGDWDIRSVVTGASVSYTCNQGFSLDGTPSRICEVSQDGLSAVWSGSLPTCSVISCPLLVAPENGGITVSGVTFQSEASFTCDVGYSLVGSTNRVCREDGAWTGTQPTCQVVDCGPLTAPNFGNVISSSTTYLSTGRYQCNAGYQLVGLSRRVCNANGAWTGDTPRCVALECGNPGAPINGGASGTSFAVGGTVRFSCLRGYKLEGSATTTCGQDGAWNNAVPLCVVVACDDPGLPANGDRDILNNNIGREVDFTCNTGYTLSGSPSRVCLLQEDGVSAAWSGSVPSCQIVDCGALLQPSNGQVSVGGTIYRSQRQFSCDVGYILAGSESRVCQADGQWSGTVATCVPVDCGDLNNPANGVVTRSSSSYLSSANYRCDPGYVLSGTSSRTCQENGEWSGSQPVCDLVSCGNPGMPANGVRTGNTFTFGGSVSFQCNSGYSLVGSSQLTCEATGRWSAAVPSCILLDCGDPGSLANGDRNMHGTTVNHRVNYTCNPGYNLFGSSFRVCVVNDAGTAATWNQNIPNCVAVICIDPGTPVDGSRDATGTSFTYGNEINYACNLGYTLVGSANARCMANAQWSTPRPVCQIVDCGPLRQPAFGSSITTSTQYLGTTTHTCNDGHSMLGSSISTCQANGQWSFPEPLCIAINCGDPGIPANGDRTGNDFFFESSVSFTCNSGYRLTGSQSALCTASGLWSNPPPRCILLSCPDPGRPNNGDRDFVATSLGAVVNYTCNTGYSIRGAAQRTCQEDATGLSASWSQSLPSCQVVDCGDPGPLASGTVTGSSFIYNSQVSFSCNPGYRLSGSVLRTCLASGVWSGQAASCVLIDCGDPGNVANGVRSGQSTTYNSVVSFVCNTGYRLFGSDRRVCQENEMWSGSQPTCQIVDCGDPGTPSNGNKQLTVTTYSSIATFSCNQGYDLVGSARRECEANGQWSGTQPICNAIICADPGTPENGGRDGSSLLLGSTVRYFCNPGYQLVGSETRTCQANGRFSGSLPSCQIISCGNPGSPENGNRQGNDFTFTSQVTFTCNTGYVLSGSRMRICLADGTWSGSVARCNLVTCPTPLPPTNGEVNANSVTYSSVASYTCNAGYKLVGAQTRTCQANGDWSLSTPECARITCCSQTAPTNGEMIGSSFDYGSNIGFRCNSGFSLTGSQQRECQGDGTWTGLPPACEPRFCEDPGLIQNGIRTEISLSVGGIAAYQCNAGYRLSGAQSLTCLADGTWSDPLPVCILDVCQDPGVPANGRRIGNSFTVGSSVNYECNDGYVLNGAITLNCQSSATWDLPRPTCDPNCQVGTWTEWSACSVTCLDGIQTRTREVTQPQGGIGAACPALQMTQACRPRDDCGCDGYPVGSIHSQLVQTEQSVGTDVVIVVDESSSMAFYHNWLSSTIKQLDDALLESNIGTDPLVPNRYALVGFGRSALPNGSDILTRPHAFSYEGQKIVHIDQYSSINSQLKEGGNIEDGYLAIDYALKNLTDENGNNLLRINEPGVAINVIFITDEDRDVLTPYGSAITRSGIKRTINRAGALLNVVVDQEFYAGNDRAFGYDSTKTAYIVEPFGEYRNATEGARLGIGYGGTRRDYTNVALELDGAAWDIKILRQAGAVGRSFTNAFLKVKTKEVLRSIDQCRRCSCVDFGRVSRLSCRKAADQPKCKMDAAAGVVETA